MASKKPVDRRHYRETIIPGEPPASARGKSALAARALFDGKTGGVRESRRRIDKLFAEREMLIRKIMDDFEMVSGSRRGKCRGRFHLIMRKIEDALSRHEGREGFEIKNFEMNKTTGNRLLEDGPIRSYLGTKRDASKITGKNLEIRKKLKEGKVSAKERENLERELKFGRIELLNSLGYMGRNVIQHRRKEHRGGEQNFWGFVRDVADIIALREMQSRYPLDKRNTDWLNTASKRVRMYAEEYKKVFGLKEGDMNYLINFEWWLEHRK
ncbi:hypothetical protein KKH30_00560 [Candidatus Micrarchaeota archaeon]|nr:hypothetical protein [Candidatus Micrarchaeota archaeon]MBU1939235.1 hypothetical protein [Candidatus Micrarchaeota archaeon]